MVLCSRCNEPIGDHWEHRWPNHGTIKVGSCSMMSSKLMGQFCGVPESPEITKMMEAIQNGQHPLVVTFGYQDLLLSWGEHGKYRLCWDCQNEFLKTIGDFFFQDRPIPEEQPIVGD